MYIQPGEKFLIEGKGFGLTPTEGKLTVNGVNVPVDSVWYNPITFGEGCWNMMATLPASLAQRTKDLISYTVRYARDGYSAEYTLSGLALPRLIVSGSNILTTIDPQSVTDFEITGQHLFANTIRFVNPGSFMVEVDITGYDFSATKVTSFVPLSELLVRGNKKYDVILFDTIFNTGYGIIAKIEIKP